jgi:hypothetical protein
MECMQKENLKDCNCTYDCPKKGFCRKCVREHREKNQLPACYFSAEAEKTYDRSIEYFIELWNNGKIN